MKHRLILLIGVVVFIAVCLVSSGIFFLTRIPSVESQIYPGSTPIHVRISAPASPTGWPLNAYIPVQAEAYGGGVISSVELYINGELYDQVESPAGWSKPEYAATWSWQPGTSGSFVLIAKAANTDGGTGISDPIHLNVTGAAQTYFPHFAKEGESLQSIAETNQISLEELKKANPSFTDPALPIPVDTPISVPNPPAPVTNLHIISGLPLLEGFAQLQNSGDLSSPSSVEENSTDNPPPPSETEESILGEPPSQPVSGGDTSDEPPNPAETGENTPGESPQTSRIQFPSRQDLQFWLGETLPGKDVSLPHEPVLKAIFHDCDVTLELANSPLFNNSSDPTVDTSSNESGFFIYKSQDGGPFERIATLPEVIMRLTWEYEGGYSLPDQYGVVTYAISAFNSAGETMSAPVTLPLDQANCENPHKSVADLFKIRLEDGNLILPFGMDLAYMYLSINDTRSHRVPEGDSMFLPDSGVKLNLNDYFNTLLKSFTDADFDIEMEVWGWSRDKLINVGTYKTTIHRSVLLVCSEEGEGKCSGNEDGEWLSEINFSDQKPIKDQVYEFKWIGSQISKVKDVCYQFAAGPFPDDNFWNMDEPITSGCMQYISGSEGTFTMYMGSLLYPTEQPEFTGWGAGSEVFDYNSTWFQETYKEGTPFTIYARALPRLEMSGFTQFSNQVTLHNNTAPTPSNLPPLASPYPSLYEVEILQDTYIPPTFETLENWGCVVVDEDPGNPSNVGKTICPPKPGTHDDCAGQSEAVCLLKGLGDAILYVVDQFVYAIKMIKWEMTEAITYSIPYCHDYGPCYSAVEEIVEQIVYYGIGYPPHTNTSEDLMAGWIGGAMLSSASNYTKDIGVDEEMLKELCGDDCQEKIGLQVIQSIRQKKSMESQNACINAYQAYFHGREPMCLDPSIIVHPAEGSGNYPAGITIKITRKELPAGQSPAPGAIEKYKIRVNVTGSNDTTAYGAGYTAPLYSMLELPVYILNPGESMILNTMLTPCKIIGKDMYCDKNDWERLASMYFKGTTTIEATELCHSPGSSIEWVPCSNGGYDTWQFANPDTGLYDQP